MTFDNAAKYTVAVDCDGVIHSYTSRWISNDVLPDPPVPGAIEWLTALSRHFRVVIFSTRASTDEGRAAIRRYLVENGLPLTIADRVDITHEKVPALLYVDDRGYRFDGTNFPTPQQILQLRPWNKRPMGLRS